MKSPDGALSPAANTKLGPLIHSWSIPAGPTCPGESHICKTRCYAKHGFFVMPNVAAFHQRNYVFSRTHRFVPWMINHLAENPIRVLRIHVAGDFYAIEYIDKWHEIVRRTPRVLFFAYTRSWRIEWHLPALVYLSRLPNLSLWFSLDRETGSPPLIPGIRRAYMAINDVDARRAPDDCDLVFRDHPRSQMKKANGLLVCPPENGVQGRLHHTCTTCGLCWNKRARAKWEDVLPLMTVEPRELQAPAA